MVTRTKKNKKAKKWRGRSTYGHGARKKWKGSGHHGGCGMSGSGKRADHKKSLVIKLYGNKYFGKKGVTSRSSKRKKNNCMNLGDIRKNIDKLTKKDGKPGEIVLKNYKILGEGELGLRVKIIARAFSANALEKIKKSGGEAVLSGNLEKKGGTQDAQEKKVTRKKERTLSVKNK